MITETQQNELAVAMQQAFPVAEHPYRVLSDKLGVKETDVLDTVQMWKSENRLREISAVMEGWALGYDSALVCGKIPKHRLEEVAGIISAHPTITHNYERNHEMNLWFTIAVPKSMGIENHLQALSSLTGIPEYFPLRRTLTFKVGVVFDFQTRKNDTVRIDLPPTIEDFPVTEAEKRIIRALQSDLPVDTRPFALLGEMHGFSESDLLLFANRAKGKALRRYVATFRHRKMGISANGMTVWNVHPSSLADAGKKLATAREVSHCYARSTFAGFPYNLYSMLHGPDSASIAERAAELSSEIGAEDYLILESPTEFKKTRLRYFLPELTDWWNQNEKLAA